MKLSQVLAEIAKLAETNPAIYDYEVKTEGCDCIGECSGVVVDLRDKDITFTRTPGK